MSRQVTSILSSSHSIQQNSATSNDRLRQNPYMQLVGTVNNEINMKTFNKMIDSRENILGTIESAPSISIMESEDIEFILEHITLHDNFYKRKTDEQHENFKCESYFNSAFYDLMKEKASYNKLEEICRSYEAERADNIDSVMEQHKKRVATTQSYFIDHGFSHDEAKASALAISFYTGPKTANPRIEDRIHRVNRDQKKEEATIDMLIISNYLIKALSNIQYHRGYVFRSCRLTDDELEFYKSGSVIMWTQFNGTFKGNSAPNSFDFPHRNTFFKIYSLTGRPIKRFSNYEDEDEILFLADTSFLVLKHVVSHHGTQHTIYMRQVELGLSTSSILWVDDHIFKDEWDNMEHMVYAEAKDSKKNIRFIEKSNTNSALGFLRSPFGQNLKNRNTFRIVTDMHRDNEQPSNNAGACLIKGIRTLGFQNSCLLFVSNKDKSEEIIKRDLNDEQRKFTTVTTSINDLRNFIAFEDIS